MSFPDNVLINNLVTSYPNNNSSNSNSPSYKNIAPALAALEQFVSEEDSKLQKTKEENSAEDYSNKEGLGEIPPVLTSRILSKTEAEKLKEDDKKIKRLSQELKSSSDPGTILPPSSPVLQRTTSLGGQKKKPIKKPFQFSVYGSVLPEGLSSQAKPIYLELKQKSSLSLIKILTEEKKTKKTSEFNDQKALAKKEFEAIFCKALGKNQLNADDAKIFKETLIDPLSEKLMLNKIKRLAVVAATGGFNFDLNGEILGLKKEKVALFEPKVILNVIQALLDHSSEYFDPTKEHPTIKIIRGLFSSLIQEGLGKRLSRFSSDQVLNFFKLFEQVFLFETDLKDYPHLATDFPKIFQEALKICKKEPEKLEAIGSITKQIYGKTLFKEKFNDFFIDKACKYWFQLLANDSYVSGKKDLKRKWIEIVTIFHGEISSILSVPEDQSLKLEKVKYLIGLGDSLLQKKNFLGAELICEILDNIDSIKFFLKKFKLGEEFYKKFTHIKSHILDFQRKFNSSSSKDQKRSIPPFIEIKKHLDALNQSFKFEDSFYARLQNLWANYKNFKEKEINIFKAAKITFDQLENELKEKFSQIGWEVHSQVIVSSIVNAYKEVPNQVKIEFQKDQTKDVFVVISSLNQKVFDDLKVKFQGLEGLSKFQDYLNAADAIYSSIELKIKETLKSFSLEDRERLFLKAFEDIYGQDKLSRLEMNELLIKDLAQGSGSSFETVKKGIKADNPTNRGQYFNIRNLEEWLERVANKAEQFQTFFKEGQIEDKLYQANLLKNLPFFIKGYLVDLGPLTPPETFDKRWEAVIDKIKAKIDLNSFDEIFSISLKWVEGNRKEIQDYFEAFFFLESLRAHSSSAIHKKDLPFYSLRISGVANDLSSDFYHGSMLVDSTQISKSASGPLEVTKEVSKKIQRSGNLIKAVSLGSSIKREKDKLEEKKKSENRDFLKHLKVAFASNFVDYLEKLIQNFKVFPDPFCEDELFCLLNENPEIVEKHFQNKNEIDLLEKLDRESQEELQKSLSQRDFFYLDYFYYQQKFSGQLDETTSGKGIYALMSLARFPEIEFDEKGLITKINARKLVARRAEILFEAISCLHAFYLISSKRDRALIPKYNIQRVPPIKTEIEGLIGAGLENKLIELSAEEVLRFFDILQGIFSEPKDLESFPKIKEALPKLYLAVFGAFNEDLKTFKKIRSKIKAIVGPFQKQFYSDLFQEGILNKLEISSPKRAQVFFKGLSSAFPNQDALKNFPKIKEALPKLYFAIFTACKDSLRTFTRLDSKFRKKYACVEPLFYQTLIKEGISEKLERSSPEVVLEFFEGMNKVFSDKNRLENYPELANTLPDLYVAACIACKNDQKSLKNIELLVRKMLGALEKSFYQSLKQKQVSFEFIQNAFGYWTYKINPYNLHSFEYIENNLKKEFVSHAKNCMNFTTYNVQEYILSQSALNETYPLIKNLIKTIKKLSEYGNFSGAYFAKAAINSSPISRLFQGEKEIGKEAAEDLAQVEALFSPYKNFQNLAEEIKKFQDEGKPHMIVFDKLIGRLTFLMETYNHGFFTKKNLFERLIMIHNLLTDPSVFLERKEENLDKNNNSNLENSSEFSESESQSHTNSYAYSESEDFSLNIEDVKEGKSNRSKEDSPQLFQEDRVLNEEEFFLNLILGHYKDVFSGDKKLDVSTAHQYFIRDLADALGKSQKAIEKECCIKKMEEEGNDSEKLFKVSVIKKHFRSIRKEYQSYEKFLKGKSLKGIDPFHFDRIKNLQIHIFDGVVALGPLKKEETMEARWETVVDSLSQTLKGSGLKKIFETAKKLVSVNATFFQVAAKEAIKIIAAQNSLKEKEFGDAPLLDVLKFNSSFNEWSLNWDEIDDSNSLQGEKIEEQLYDRSFILKPAG